MPFLSEKLDGSSLAPFKNSLIFSLLTITVCLSGGLSEVCFIWTSLGFLDLDVCFLP